MDEHDPPIPASSNAGLGQQRLSFLDMRDSFRTPPDEVIAHDILVRNRGAKNESRSHLFRVFTTKHKRTKFSRKEIFRALVSVVNVQARTGPGVVQVLRDSFIEQGGDVNFTPQKSSLGNMFGKSHEKRSGLLDRAANDANVEVVQLLSRYSDRISLNRSLEIALRDRFGTESEQNELESFEKVAD